MNKKLKNIRTEDLVSELDRRRRGRPIGWVLRFWDEYDNTRYAGFTTKKAALSYSNKNRDGGELYRVHANDYEAMFIRRLK